MTSEHHPVLGGWAQTWHGKRIHLDASKFNVDDIILADVVHHLVMVNRYGGATQYPYSVMQHCTALARSFRRRWEALKAEFDGGVIPDEIKTEIARLQICEKQALCHDWPEYIIGDVLSPFKELMPQFRALDDTMTRAIFVRNGLPAEMDPEVKEMDRRIWRNELDEFGSPHVEDKWWRRFEPVPGLDVRDLRMMSIWGVRLIFRKYVEELGLQ